MRAVLAWLVVVGGALVLRMPEVVPVAPDGSFGPALVPGGDSRLVGTLGENLFHGGGETVEVPARVPQGAPRRANLPW